MPLRDVAGVLPGLRHAMMIVHLWLDRPRDHPAPDVSGHAEQAARHAHSAEVRDHKRDDCDLDAVYANSGRTTTESSCAQSDCAPEPSWTR